jgi:hypothetical protein
VGQFLPEAVDRVADLFKSRLVISFLAWQVVKIGAAGLYIV